MKKLLLLSFIALLFSSCNEEAKKQQELKIQATTVSDLMELYRAEGDSTRLERALAMTDSLIQNDTPQNQSNHYRTKSQILALQGKFKESFKTMDLALPFNDANIERLTYNGLKFHSLGQEDLAEVTFKRGITRCDEQLKDSISNEWLMYKVKFFFYLNQPDSARLTIEKASEAKPESKALKAILSQFDNLRQSSEKYLSDIKE